MHRILSGIQVQIIWNGGRMASCQPQRLAWSTIRMPPTQDRSRIVCRRVAFRSEFVNLFGLGRSAAHERKNGSPESLRIDDRPLGRPKHRPEKQPPVYFHSLSAKERPFAERKATIFDATILTRRHVLCMRRGVSDRRRLRDSDFQNRAARPRQVPSCDRAATALSRA